jgi:serine/threonine protein kinase
MPEDSELARRAQVRVGSTLRGKYRIDAVLGVGGMATVYRATHRNQAEFAIKMLHPELGLSEDLRARFLREGYAANSVKHPGAVRVVDDDVSEDGAAFLVMELLHGKGVDVLWQMHGERLPVRFAISIGEQVLEVLAAAHEKGIVHRDIKPQNLFVTTDGTAKVLDFGIARARDAASLSAGGQGTGTGILLGTPAFMAPEQALGRSRDIDARTDLWSFSATMFTLLSGELVHAGENPAHMLVMAATERARPLATLAPDVPAAIAEVIDRGLAFDRADRWPDATAMREALCEAYRAAVGVRPTHVSLDEMIAEPPGPATATTALAAPVSSRATAQTPAPVPSTPTGSEMAFASARRGAGAPDVSAVHVDPPDGHEGTGRKRPRRALLVAALLAVSAIAVGVGLRAVTGPTEASPAAPPSSPPTALASPPAASSSGMAATLGQAPSASDAAPAPAPPAASSSATPAPARSVAHRPTPHAAPAPSAQCEPPFYYDAQGNRVFKKECL